MGRIGKYIYGIVNSNASFHLSIPKDLLLDPSSRGFSKVYPLGLGESESNGVVYTIPHQDISVLVRDSEIVDYTHMRKDILARLLVGHQTVIERIMAPGNIIIPMRLGTHAQDETEIKNILSKGYNLIKEIFEKIKDKIEIDVACTWSDFNSIIKEAGEEKEIKEFRAKLLSNSKDIAVDDQMKIGFMLKKALDKRKEEFAERMLERLGDLSEDTRTHELMDDNMVLNSAFLIPKVRRKDFEVRVEELNIEFAEKLNFRCVGPLPPYSFYTLQIKKWQFEEIDWARKKLRLQNNFATKDEIKKAHKTLAFTFHPDKNPNTPGIESEFDEITKAYKLLREYCGEDSCTFSEEEFRKNVILIKVRE